jgi:hypothetical protein
MKNKNKIEEPFDPEKTPEPAQVKHPGKQGEQPKQENQKPSKDPRSQHGRQTEKDDKPKRLGESETEIDDETTI